MSSDERLPAADPLARRTWEVGPAAVRALAVFAVVVAVVAAVLAWRGRPQVEPVTGVVTTGFAVDPGSASVPPGGVVVVAVSGHVRQPGLVRLPDGARVADAIEAAGGALDGTDLALLNLARKVTDGELILVGVTPPPGAAGADPGAPAAGAEAGRVNLNTASSAQLQTLPGVGPVLAERIIAYREEHGRFASVADLRKVTGIGDARFNELKDRVSV